MNSFSTRFQRCMTKALILGLFFGATGRVAASDDAHGEKRFNPSEFIIHHIQDAHEVHLFGGIHIPLPVIAYAPETGQFDVFMSSALHHGAHLGGSGLWYTLNHGVLSAHEHDPSGHHHQGHEGHAEKEPADEHHGDHLAGGVDVIDLSITKSIFGMLLMMGLVLLLFGRAAKGYSKRKGQAPTGLQNVLEPMVLFIRDEVAIPSIGKQKADRYLPFLLTVFFFIFFSNLLGLIPFIGGFNITGTLGITMVLATLVFLITTVSGNKHYWGHILWPSGVPLPVKFILVPIEIASIFIKPAVLMIRLTANITAGHIIILSFTSLIFILGEEFGGGVGMGTGVFSTLFMIFMYLIEFLVAFLQAYVFTLLAALYFGEATHEAHH